MGLQRIYEQDWFSTIRHPSRYLGNEVNIIKKDPSSTEVCIALAFPDVYEVGMSHQGFKILYHILNKHDWLAAERVFTPWVDMERELRLRNLPLCSLESGRCLSDFDIIGFSLQHELAFTNVLNMLDLSGIPLLSSERDHTHPLIIAGGPACFNPEPIADIFDLIVIGDGEELSLTICSKLRDAKAQAIGKKEILHELSNINGIYIPSYFKTHYNLDGSIDHIEPLQPGYREIRRAIISDLEESPFPVDQVVPFAKTIHDRLAIEISRGCTRGCRFCQAGMIYRPVRERSPESILQNVDKALRLTGFEEISLLSLSSGDYSCIAPLLKELMNRHSSDKTAISFPSLRIDSLDPIWLEQIKRVRKTGFTLAPEVGNDRLRKIINKSLTNKEILSMAKELYDSGWMLIKLYFMIGLPLEEEKDIYDIIELANQVSGLSGKRGDKVKLNVSVSTFVPKAHTPFMWAPQISLEESIRRINLIRRNLSANHRVRVKWNQPESSRIEGIFSRGDRRLTPALINAWALGARFDAWSDQLRIDLWEKAFKKADISPEFYLERARSLEEIMPWGHIKTGVSEEYFKEEWKKALEAIFTRDCRDKCLDCGVCDHKNTTPIIRRDWIVKDRNFNKYQEGRNSHVFKYLLTFSKTGESRFLSHLELSRLFIRAIKRADLRIAFSRGYHPMPKVSFLSALPVGTESLHEALIIELHDNKQLKDIKDAINNELPVNVHVIKIENLPEGKQKLRLMQSYFSIIIDDYDLNPLTLEDFLSSDKYMISKNRGKNSQAINARELVKSIKIISRNSIELVINHVQGPELKPIEIITDIFRIKGDLMNRIKILKTRQVIGKV